ncbi:MAG: hypothetical protein HY599_00235 [Candidatus Omnitrophica bacterium]|nr:hypothetical protein [Candidatus Omnitrophota bacterium]
MSLVAEVEAARIEYQDGLPIVHLSGSPYEIGRQHGELLRERVRASVARVLGFFRSYLKVPLVRVWAVNWWLDTTWRAGRPYVPSDDLEELRGLSDGSGVPLRELYRLHAIPDRTYSCSMLAAWGQATADGRLIHVRNLDWTIEADIQRFAAVFVVRPNGQQAFVNIGWAGFTGVLTGINDHQVSVGQIGAETVDATFRGEPMVFLLKRVLKQADDVEEAAALVRGARRTVGANYVFADAKARRAMVIETTARAARVFEANDPAEHGVPYARPMIDAVFRADTAVDPIIRNRQLASRGDPGRPGLEAPSGSAYDVRYLGQAAGVQAHYGALTAEQAKEIARKVAPRSNVQSVIFAWPEAWVANAQDLTPAAETTYHRLDLERLFEEDQ